MSLFADLDRLKAELDTLRPLAPEQEARVLQKFRLDWNYNSNAIEGNSLSLGETRSLLLHGLTAAGKPLRDHIDIEGHNEAVLWLEDFVRDERPLTEQFIRGMHEVLLKEPYEVKAQTASGQPTRKRIVPGQYKTAPNNVLTATGEIFYFASVEETPARMTDLVDWYRQEEATPTMHHVALATEFHYRFVRIHPFDDGNGRMSRLLMNLILLRHSYAITVIKATDRNRYLAALSEADAGQQEPFLRFIIENVEASLRLMIRAAKGESIEEASDLDKKLALLKKQILTREDAISLVWAPTTQVDFYNKILVFWLTNLAEQMHRFNDFFISLETDFFSKSASDKSWSTHTSYTLEEALNLAKHNFSQENQTVDTAYFRFDWKEFRVAKNIFNLRAFIRFNFRRHDFNVAFGISLQKPEILVEDIETITVFNTVYKRDYDQAQIHEINYQLANKVYDFIANKLAEADTPPA